MAEIVAKSMNVRVSPRKLRPVADAVKKLSVGQALERLPFLAKSGAKPLLLTLQSAVANATNNNKLKIEDLKIKNILIDEGLKMKRRDKSHNVRFGGGLRVKKASHIKVILQTNG